MFKLEIAIAVGFPIIALARNCRKLTCVTPNGTGTALGNSLRPHRTHRNGPALADNGRRACPTYEQLASVRPVSEYTRTYRLLDSPFIRPSIRPLYNVRWEWDHRAMITV